MSILNIAAKRRKIQKSLISILAMALVCMLFMAACVPRTALATSVEDVLAEVAQQTSNPDNFSGTEPVPGGSFNFYEELGELNTGWAYFSICKPVGNTPMQAVIDFATGQLDDDASLRVSPMTGYKLGEVTYADYHWGLPNDEVEAWIILPNYLIKVEVYDTGYDKATNLQMEKDFALQLMGGLEKAGLLNPTAPDTAEKTKTEVIPANGAVVSGKPLDEPILVSNTMNIAGVYNQPTAPTTFTINQPHLVTNISNYHWNNAKGAAPGQIGFKDQNGKVYGPWQAKGRPGQGGVPNAYWDVFPNVVIPAGTYTLTDSDPATWSQNSQSGGKGMSEVKATPHFTSTNNSGQDTGSSGTSESPAGVGSVGNIPGPANTTEAVVGVVVPGLIATGLGALAGLGGGGGFAPPGGASPAGGPTGTGSSPAGGPSGGSGNAHNSKIQEVAQIGRKKRESEPEFVPVEPKGSPGQDPAGIGERSGIIIDTVDMIDGNGAITIGDQVTAAENGLFIEPGEEALGLVHPEPGIFIETEEEGLGLVHPEPDIFIETNDESSVLIQPSAGVIIDTADEAGVLIQNGQVDVPTANASDGEILVDTSALDMQEPIVSGANEDNINIDNENLATDGNDNTVLKNDGSENIYDQSGYDKDGYNVEGFDKDGFDRNGFNKEGYNIAGRDKDGFDQDGYDVPGYDRDGYDPKGYDREGFDRKGFDEAGYDENGFDKSGFDKEGYNEAGFNREHFDREGFDKNGYSSQGYDREGFNKAGYDSQGYNKEGFNREGYNIDGYNAKGYDRQGFDRSGYDSSGYDRKGYNQTGYNREGYNAEGYNQDGYDRSGYDQAGFDKEGFNKDSFDKDGYDREGYRQDGYDEAGYDRKGFNKEGLDKDGFDKNGFDAEGYGRNGFDKNGYDREGYDVNGYDEHGYNHSGYDAKGYNKSGYNKEGFDKDGWDKDGYGRNGLNKAGYDREGYDAKGYDKDGYNRDGYDRKGMQREGYDENGFDKDGYNKNGVDKDGFDREGFNFEGYNRSGYDPWGYNRQGYGKDGYHWSGYNADGYSREGKHWSENPYEGDGNPFNVAKQDPFAEKDVIPFGVEWKPTKPKLGEPFPKTLEKYGAKPWTNETGGPDTPDTPAPVPTPTPGKDAIVPGPQDPQGTLENHEVGSGQEAATPEESSIPTNIPEEDWPEKGGEPGGQDTEIPDEQPLAPIDNQDTFTVTDPETGETTTYEYLPGYKGPKHGDTQVLVGKADGRTYELEFNATTGKWVNQDTGADFDPEDFERWQNDLAEDKRRIAEDIEKMSQRQDANSKAIDKNLDDWQKLEQMQKAADKYNIGEKGGPGDVDKAIQDLKDDMLANRELDQEKMEKINKLIDNRIKGNTAADNGERWEQDPWYTDVGSALEANAAMAKEVVTGEDADGNTSYLGMTARIMIGIATGGGAANVATDGILTISEAMYRIKDSVDKGASDFDAVSNAIGMVILEEGMGRMIGAAGEGIGKQMMERFPALTQKAANIVEEALLNVKKIDQLGSASAGLISKEAAEEAVKKINKELAELSAELGENGIKKAMKNVGKEINSSIDDAATSASKSVADSSDDLAAAAGKNIGSGAEDAAAHAGKATVEAGDEIASNAGKKMGGTADDIPSGKRSVSSASGDDIPGGSGKGPAESPDDIVKPGKAAPDSGDGPNASSKSSNDVPDDAPTKNPASGTDEGAAGNAAENSINSKGGRSNEEILNDPVALKKAEDKIQKSVKDFDKLPPTKQQDLIKDQAIYDEYKIQAEEKTWKIADKVQNGEKLSVEDVLNLKADPASMRTIKNIEEVDGLGAELGIGGSRQVKTEFNEVLEKNVYQPSYKDVQESLSPKYGGAEIRVQTVRTPGTTRNPWDINTDNDIVAQRLVVGKDGVEEWVEIPRGEWEDVYYKSYAQNTGFNPQDAANKFPDTNWEKKWSEMSEIERVRKWGELHGETPADVYHIEGGRDFSNQRTAILNGESPDGNLFGQNGCLQRTAVDPEQLAMMEKNKINSFWTQKGSPAEVMKNQTESMEQLSKAAATAKKLEAGFKARDYKIAPMPDNMEEAIKVVNNNKLSPASRAARLQELGYDSPGDFVEKLTSRIGAIRAARQ